MMMWKIFLKKIVLSKESGLEQTLNSVSDKMGDLLSVAAPAAFARMTALSQISASCRLGTADPRKRPFSGMSVIYMMAKSKNAGE